MTLQVFHAHHSTCSQKVRLCLAEKQIDWVSRPVDLSAQEHLRPAYLAINPNGVVPAIVHDGHAIVESTVICEYLDEVFTNAPALTPADPVARAQMRAWLRYIDEVPSMAVRVPSFRKVFLPAFEAMTQAEFDAFVDANVVRKHFFRSMGRHGFSDADYDASIEQLAQTLTRMERALESADWLVANRFSIADICLVPVVVRMEDLGLELLAQGTCPRVESWYARVQQRPSFETCFYAGSRISHLRPGFAAQAV